MVYWLLASASLALQIPDNVHAQQAQITYEEARTAMDAAEAEARKNGWKLTIVIADSAGIPIYLRRMSEATPRSYEIAMAKVRTVLTSKMHTADYARALAEGRVDTVRTGVTYEGGHL